MAYIQSRAISNLKITCRKEAKKEEGKKESNYLQTELQERSVWEGRGKRGESEMFQFGQKKIVP